MTDYHWARSANGNFNAATNWSPSAIPGSADVADLDASGTYTVTTAVSNTVDALNTVATATLNISAGTFTNANYNDDSDNYGTITVANSGALSFGAVDQGSNDLYNEGTIKLNAAGTSSPSARLIVSASFTRLLGGGTLTLSSNIGNALISNGSTAELENVDNTITGGGTIGDAHLTFDNGKGGTVTANDAVALTFNTGANAIYNAGTVSSTGTGGLVIASTFYNNGSLLASGSGGLVLTSTINGTGTSGTTASGAHIDLKNGSLNGGGLLSVVAGSQIDTVAGTTNLINTDNYLNAGKLLVANGSTLVLEAFLANSGSIAVNGGAAATKLQIGSYNTRLTGGGTLTLTNNAHNQIVSTGSAATLDNRDNTISGAGTLGDANLRFVNEAKGSVIANGSVALILNGNTNSSLNVDSNTGLMETTGTGGLSITGNLTNSGTLEAIGSGALLLKNASINDGSGLMQAATSGAHIDLSNTSIYNGTLSTVSGSKIDTLAGTTNTLDSGLYNSGSLVVTNNSTLILGDHTVNTGTIALNGSTAATKIEVGADQWKLTGGGSLTMTDSVNNAIVSAGAATQFRNHDNVISGAGTIGDSNMTLQNTATGVIDATGQHALILNTGSNAIINGGTIESTASGGLTVQSALTNNGTLSSSAGVLNLVGTVNGFGSDIISGSGEIEFGASAYQDVAFASGASGTLRFDEAASSPFEGTIKGLTSSDKLDFSDLSFGTGTTESFSGTASHGVLTISDGTHATSVTLLGNYVGQPFDLATDNHGGTFVTG